MSIYSLLILPFCFRTNGEMINNNNINSAVLDDEPMPSTLCDQFKQLYDKEWAEGLQKLTKHMSQEDAIHSLLLVLKVPTAGWDIYVTFQGVLDERTLHYTFYCSGTLAGSLYFE